MTSAPTACRRFIPAPAGNTTTLPMRRLARTVHPRACGEHRAGPDAYTTAHGSSPRLRGTRLASLGAGQRRRFIPAPAGNTHVQPRHCGRCAVHPRACGEHSHSRRGRTPRAGSSPRLRGTRKTALMLRQMERFIPAPAGNTARGWTMNDMSTVHPRACGEHDAFAPAGGRNVGSSPRLRGTPIRRMGNGADWRFIPAPAGNTAGWGRLTLPTPVHPRACGEHKVGGAPSA